MNKKGFPWNILGNEAGWGTEVEADWKTQNLVGKKFRLGFGGHTLKDDIEKISIGF